LRQLHVALRFIARAEQELNKALARQQAQK
jgi:hypothetical protein